ncbi:MAG: 3-hydroxy-5-phosphonooxypentane-2,4-dione thiolase, partial [Candidatus Omnitrophica bacterium]|nr:3-hydroxy-5-phosphonooxypentane-2,4-dione thiolase [Candidatus Omnitrophota bacterium]MCK5081955.1 3-hydroxy-5-phosphonooxypentane-2,4-dione thiolase [Candidatus Omnitrophota bacterium]MCK5180595.1 3-hydroxy-5-phosphonooxypentane-2,4-dione thiolase [Candidatus Omnitrophota bacterium]
MDWGMENRLNQLMPGGKCFFMPIDHGYFQGPTTGLEKPGETVAPLLPYVDAIFCTRGVLRSAIDPANTKPIVLRASGCTSIIGSDLANEEITTSVEEIIRVNAAAAGVSVFVGSDYERQSLSNLANLVNDCEDYGIPVMAVTAVGKELEKREARYLGLCCRIAAELGARVVKTYWCEKDFDKVVAGCPVPVIMAGGPKCETEREVFEFVHDGMQNGAVGINLGRNVWKTPHPVGVAKALQAIIHQNVSVREAEEIFKESKEKDTPAGVK